LCTCAGGPWQECRPRLDQAAPQVPDLHTLVRAGAPAEEVGVCVTRPAGSRAMRCSRTGAEAAAFQQAPAQVGCSAISHQEGGAQGSGGNHLGPQHCMGSMTHCTRSPWAVLMWARLTWGVTLQEQGCEVLGRELAHPHVQQHRLPLDRHVVEVPKSAPHQARQLPRPLQGSRLEAAGHLQAGGCQRGGGQGWRQACAGQWAAADGCAARHAMAWPAGGQCMACMHCMAGRRAGRQCMAGQHVGRAPATAQAPGWSECPAC